jgi:hypothetical protein
MARMMSWLRDMAAVCVSLCLLAAAPARGAEGVKVQKGDVTSEYKYFDPRHLPDPAPPLEHGESAVTVYGFGVETYVRYTYAAPAEQGGSVKVNFTIREVTLKLSCKVTEWLPEDPPAALRAHEDGHRAIAEHFYKHAEEVARGLAKKEVGQTVTGRGANAESAGNAVIDKVSTRVNDGFSKAITDPCKKAQAAFDRITDHGRNGKDAKEAVEMAIKEGKGK